MAIYIDPTTDSSGTGTFADPYDSWADVTWAANTTYLQKEGTTFSGTIAPSTSGTAGNKIVIGAYDATTGAMIVEPERYFYVDGGLDYGVNLSSGASRSYIDLLNCWAIASEAAKPGIWGQSGVTSTVRNNTIRYCRGVSALSAGIQVRGSGWLIEHNICNGNGADGIYADVHNSTIRYNETLDNDTQLTNGDDIQMNATEVGGCGIVWIYGNKIEHPLESPKQGIICTYVAGVCVVYENDITRGGQSAIAVDGPDGQVFRNRIRLAHNAISVLGVNLRADDNDVEECDTGLIFIVDTRTGTLARGNSFRRMVDRVVTMDSGTTGNVITFENNFIEGCGNGDTSARSILIPTGNTFTSNYNAWTGQLAPFSYHGTAYATMALYATASGNEANSIQPADPLVNDYGVPMVNSPLLGAGRHLGYRRDINKRQRRNPPAIGANDLATLRVAN